MFTSNTSKFPAHRGRMSDHQKFVFNTELSNYSVKKLHKIENYTIVDIGFGNGNQLLSLSETMPEHRFIGIELYKKGLANCADQIRQKKLQNIQLIYGEAKTALQDYFYDRSIFKVQILFPDPWPKRKHHKRRLIQNDFINIVKCKLCINGVLHIATDSNDYAEYILKIIYNFPEFVRIQNEHDYINRTTTKFEKIGVAAGRTIWDLIFVLKF